MLKLFVFILAINLIIFLLAIFYKSIFKFNYLKVWYLHFNNNI